MEQPAIDVAAALKIEEQLFKPNGYRGVESGASYTILPGSVPILVSAPHAVKHIRKGNTEPKEEDEYTGTVARLLHASMGCWAMHATAVDLDPNFYDDCAYKDALRELLKKEPIRLVLDLHGAVEWRAFNIDLGTCRGDSLLDQGEYLEDLILSLQDEGIQSVFVDSVFTAEAQSTVTRFVSEQLGIPAVQLEINRRLRDPEQNPAYFSVLIKGLQSFIRDLD